MQFALTLEVLKIMLLTKLKLGTAAVLCACLIGGSFTSLGIAQDAKPKPAVGGRLDLDFQPKPAVGGRLDLDFQPKPAVGGRLDLDFQLSLVNQKSKSQPKSKVRTVDLGRILDLLDRDTDLDGDACPDILLDLGGGTQILLTNYRAHLRGGKPGKDLKDVNPKGGNPGGDEPNIPQPVTGGDNKPDPIPQPVTGGDNKPDPIPQPVTGGDNKPGPNSGKPGGPDIPPPMPVSPRKAIDKHQGKEVKVVFRVGQAFVLDRSVPMGELPPFGLVPEAEAFASPDAEKASPRFHVLVSGELVKVMERLGVNYCKPDEFFKGRDIEVVGTITQIPTQGRPSYELWVSDWKKFRIVK
jgi:hypothetical protein